MVCLCGSFILFLVELNTEAPPGYRGLLASSELKASTRYVECMLHSEFVDKEPKGWIQPQAGLLLYVTNRCSMSSSKRAGSSRER